MNAVLSRKYLLGAISVVTLLFLVAIFFIVKGGITTPSELFKKKVTDVEMKKTYKNPFAKNSQYVNPFQEYKNPFITNR